MRATRLAAHAHGRSEVLREVELTMIPVGDENVRGAGPSFVTFAIIALNIFVFFLQMGGESITYGWSVVPYEITHGVDLVRPVAIATPYGREVIPQRPGPSPIYLTLFSAMFMHGGFGHIFSNMLFLWIFGDNVEHRLKHGVYLIFYLVCGLVASFAQILLNPDSPIPNLGASGAISGVLGAYLVFFPHNRVRVASFYGIWEVPALVMIGLWAVTQFVNGFGAIAVSEEVGGVAYGAHIGGFLAGVVIAFLLRGMRGAAPSRRHRWA